MLLDPGLAEAAIREGRIAAESLMVDACVVERDTGQTTTDPVTGKVVKVFETTYTGKCKVQGRSAVAVEPSAGGHVFTVEQLQVHLPVSAQSMLDDRVTVTVATVDEDLVGLVLRLTELARGTYRTADRWNVEMIAG
ncbi:DUF6093 family protein [Glutamicibacter sp. AOP5-A2-7]